MGDNSYPQHERTKTWVDGALSEKGSATFDDSNDTWAKAPEAVADLAEIANTDVAKGHQFASGRQMVAAVLDSAVKHYEKEHGCKPSGAVLDSAFRVARNSVSREHLVRAVGMDVAMDSTSIQSDAPLVANRAAVVLHQAIIEALPFAGVLPMSEALQGKIIVASHNAGNTVGAYQSGNTLDGLAGGNTFMSAERVVEMTGSGTAYSAKILYADSDTAGSPVIPSHTEILVNGIPAGGAQVNAKTTDANVPLLGSASIPDGNGGTTEISFTGTLKTNTGEINVTFSSALPSGATVQAVGLLNYEHETMKGKRPRVVANADVYDFRAAFTSALYQVSQEARVQFASEVRLDAGSEAMLAMSQQGSAERHMNALRSMYRVAKNYVHTANMDVASRINERSLENIFKDVLFTLTQADQAMIERTEAVGIRKIYVGGKGKSYMTALPREIFTPSGITSRVGIYRIGTLFGQYDVYYAPNIVKETSNSFEMLAIGQSEQTGLNPYIVGDVVPPTFGKLAIDTDLKDGAFYFHAGAARVNPYRKAAQGAALIAVTGL